MRERPRLVAMSAVLACAAACSPAPSASPLATGSSATALPSSTPSGSSTSGLPDLGLANVKTETAQAAAATITSEGGTISATARNGTEYTLTLPPDAVAEDTEVALYPVESLANLPSGASITSGVQFAPDGLHLEVPGTLTIRFPAGTDASQLLAMGWHGDGEREHYEPALVDGNTVTMTVFHFSGGGTVSPEPALVALDPCSDSLDFACETDRHQHILARELGEHANDAELLLELQDWYQEVVVPALGGPFDLDAQDARITAYDAWRSAISIVRSRTGDPSFAVDPEFAESKVLAARFLRALYVAWNAECVANKTEADWRVPTALAEVGIRVAGKEAILWDIPTVPNRLDIATLLANACARLQIDWNHRFSAVGPGDSGTISLLAGMSIAGGPLQTGAGDIHVKISLTGATSQPFEADTDVAGGVTTTATWPAGVDPLTINVAAVLIDMPHGRRVPSDIARSDRATLHAQRLVFTFDRGFDGWSSGVAGSSPSNWGLVDHLSIGGGVIHMDGRGVPSRPNAWISRSFDLPESTTTLSFDASAEIIPGSSSLVQVRIDANGASTTILNATLRNSRTRLSFARITVNISRWAGQHVRIFIEQNDNTPAGTSGYDKEIYIDNVRISTT